jgi:exopolysaccharide biosynthesis WecB/TagA/CpsF family protein
VVELLDTTTQRRILLVQLADIGNLVLTTPAIVALRQAYPNAHLSLLTTRHSTPIIDEGLVDEVIAIDRRQVTNPIAFFAPSNLKTIYRLRDLNCDTVIFFHHFSLRLGTIKFALIAWATQAQHLLGMDNGHGWFLTESIRDEGFGAKHEAQYALEIVGLMGVNAPKQRSQVAFSGGVLPIPATSQKRVIIHTGSGGYSVARRWLPQYFAQVADELANTHNAQVIFVGTPSDGVDAVIPLLKHKPINLVGKTNLPQLADLIRSADVYIGADSGVMHMAASVRTPVIAIFGSSNAEAWSPYSPNGITVVLRSQPMCSPCMYVENRIGAKDGCEARTCLKMVTPAQVIQVANAILTNKPIPQFSPIQYSPRLETEETRFLKIDHARLNTPDFVQAINKLIQTPSFHLVILSHSELLLKARRDPILFMLLQRAHLVVPCGLGLQWASNWKKDDLPERLSRPYVVGALLEHAEKSAWRVYLLGGASAELREVLREALPHLQIVGTSSASPDPEHETQLVEQINATQPHLLLSGWAQPLGEKWLARNAPRLKVRVNINIGETMNELAGLTPVVPENLQELRLGWLYLLLRQPKRLRAIWRTPQFVMRTILEG